MRIRIAAGWLAFCASGLPICAFAQTPPRIKAVVVSFDGNTLTVMPDGESQAMKIGVRPATRILKEESVSLASLKVGDFVGATLSRTPIGAFSAQEVHLFPAPLRGSGEGIYPASPGSNRSILNGTVSAAGPSTLTVRFRGASGDGPSCTGRAPINPLNGCQGIATFEVAPATPVLTLAASDKSQLTPGAVLALSIIAGSDGRPVTPGLTIESVATPPVPLPPISAPKNSSDKRPFLKRP